MADVVNVTRQTSSLIESNKCNPSLKLCMHLAKTLDKSLDRLFGRNSKMEKLKNWFSLSTHSDERIQQIEMKIWAQSGIIVLILAFIDVVIRGAYLNRPFLEWIASLAIIICYMIFFFIKSILTGVYETEINNKEQLNEKLKE
ncbi:TPA: hypothetical protein QCY24_006099, partial [Bacillus wiedmannii]|nr:hypothetical protein [Bacillus wiedmannii]